MCVVLVLLSRQHPRTMMAWYPFTFPMKLYMEVGEENDCKGSTSPMAARPGWMCRPSAMAMNEGQVSQSENDDRLKAWENKKLHSPFTKNLFIRLWYVLFPSIHDLSLPCNFTINRL